MASVLVLSVLVAAVPEGSAAAPTRDGLPDLDYTTIIEDPEDHHGFHDLRTISVAEPGGHTVVFRFGVADTSDPPLGAFLDVSFTSPRGDYYIGVDWTGEPWTSSSSPAGFESCDILDDAVYCTITYEALGVVIGDTLTDTWADSTVIDAPQDYAPGDANTGAVLGLVGRNYTIEGNLLPPDLVLTADRSQLTAARGQADSVEMALDNDGEVGTNVTWTVEAPDGVDASVQTFKDRIEHYETHEAHLTVEAGDDAPYGHHNVTVTATGDGTSSSLTFDLTIPDLESPPDGPAFTLGFDAARATIPPGGSVQVHVDVENRWDRASGYVLSVDDADTPGDWSVFLHPRRGHVEAGEAASATLSISVPATADPKLHHLTLTVVDDAGRTAEQMLPVTVLAAPDVPGDPASTAADTPAGALLPGPSIGWIVGALAIAGIVAAEMRDGRRGRD